LRLRRKEGEKGRRKEGKKGRKAERRGVGITAFLDRNGSSSVYETPW
jgi:hypothetical protein